MNIKPHRLLSVLGFAALTIASLMARAAEVSYHSLKEIPVGGQGGFDYLTVDAESQRLYVPHGTKIVVIDTEKDAIVGEITDTPGVHGFALASDLKRGFSSNGRENKVSIVDLETLKTLSKVETGRNPDDILYEPNHQEVYAFNGQGRSVTVFEAKTGKVVTTIPLPGKPEFSVVDATAGKVFCNIEDKSEIAVIDSQTHRVVNDWPIAPGAEASGLAIDLEHHRLFAVCANKLMVMLDSTTGKVIATVPIGSGADAGSFDPGTQLAFSSNGDSATVTIAHEDVPDKLTVVQTLKTQKGARTMALDTKTHKLYLAVGQGESFKVLVYGK